MPLIILGFIVIIAVVLSFSAINTGVKRRQNEVEDEDEDDGKVIALFELTDPDDEKNEEDE